VGKLFLLSGLKALPPDSLRKEGSGTATTFIEYGIETTTGIAPLIDPDSHPPI